MSRGDAPARPSASKDAGSTRYASPVKSASPILSRKQKRRWRRRIGGMLMRVFGPAFVRALSRTWKTEVLGRELLGVAARADPRSTVQGQPGCMIAIWHGRMLVGVEYGRK